MLNSLDVPSPSIQSDIVNYYLSFGMCVFACFRVTFSSVPATQSFCAVRLHSTYSSIMANENMPHERAINTWRINCTEYYWKCKTMNVVFSIEIHKNWIAFRGSEFLALYIYIHNLNAHATQPNREIWQNWTATESSWIFATESTKTWIEMNNSFDSIFSFCWFLLDFFFNQILCTWRGSLHAFDLSNIWEWFCLHSCWCCIARLNYKFCVNNFQNNTDKYILLQKLDGINEITLRIG